MKYVIGWKKKLEWKYDVEIFIWISRNYAISFNFPGYEPMKLDQNWYDI